MAEVIVAPPERGAPFDLGRGREISCSLAGGAGGGAAARAALSAVNGKVGGSPREGSTVP